MAKPIKLWKTTIVVWTDYAPHNTEIEDLVREATCGDAYCSTVDRKLIQDFDEDEDWDGTEFFDDGEDEDG